MTNWHSNKLSKEQVDTEKVFAGCSEMSENGSLPKDMSIGDCINKGIISKEEAKNGKYHLTKLGEKAKRVAEQGDVSKGKGGGFKGYYKGEPENIKKKTS